jgi:predicted 3-demethylubiquinone-9 3-methyltransferase (glyoxalase superfamily)
MTLQKITPFLWFEKGAEDAAKFYTSVFKNSKILSTNPMVTSLELEGLTINILNGGPQFKLDEAFSLCVSCDTQEEIDYYWNTFTKNGGEESMCGWCKDKYGVSWQVIPSILPQLMSDPQKSQRVVDAFLKMKKFDIETLKKA